MNINNVISNKTIADGLKKINV